MFWLAIRKPQLFQYGMFQTLESMLVFLKQTADAKRPMSSLFGIKPIAKINYEGEVLLSLWCGVDEKDNPLTRIRELAEENAQLRLKLLKMIQEDERSAARDDHQGEGDGNKKYYCTTIPKLSFLQRLRP